MGPLEVIRLFDSNSPSKNGMSALIKKTPHKALLSLLTHEGHSTKAMSVNQKAGSHQTPNLSVPQSWTYCPQNCEKQTYVV